MRQFSVLSTALLLTAVGLFSCQSTPPEEKAAQKPNILFIMSDDHAYQAVSAYGFGLNQTPNIDRLAEEGAIFTRACVTNSICAPSRAVLLTGKHSFINGKVDNAQPFNWDQDNFPKLMQANGYQTAMIGKIHLDGLPQGFDFSMVLPGQGAYYNPDFLINGERKRFEGYCTEIITETMLDWLKTQRDPNKPFCALYHQKAPHRNWKPAPKYLTLYDDVTFEPPANYFDDYEGRGTAAKEQEMQVDGHASWGHDFKMVTDPNGKATGFANELKRFNEKQRADWLAAYTPKNDAMKAANLEGEDLGKWKFNRYIKDYLRTIKSVDDGVGEVLDYLEEAGIADNTIVVYTSDQGFYLGEHGWFDKRFMYEESFRTPLLVRYPREIKPGTRIERLVQNLDFAPTMLELAGIPVPDEMQGRSFAPLLRREPVALWRRSMYYHFYEYPGWHYVKRHYGVRTERFKLIHFYHDIDAWELYDLAEDPLELDNVYEDPRYTGVRAELHAELRRLQAQYGDSSALAEELIERYPHGSRPAWGRIENLGAWQRAQGR